MAGKMFLGNTAITPVIIKGGEPTGGIQIGYYVDENGALKKQDSGDLVLSGFKSIDVSTMFGSKFSKSSITSVSAPDLEEISSRSAFSKAFYRCSLLKSVDFPKLEKVNGDTSFDSTFEEAGIESISFPKLKEIKGMYAFNSAFRYCDFITDIYFPELTTSSFGEETTQFSYMFDETRYKNPGIFTVHFPSNLESTIQALDGYPYFGNFEGYLVLAFDLPATE